MARPTADGRARTIHQLVEIKYQSSGLTVLHARKLRLKALTASQVHALSPKFHAAGALQIPYFDLHGRPTKFYRVRYLEKLPGVAGLVEKPQRYDQLPIMQEVYYPPLLKSSWSAIAKDPKVSVAITEGELKAACACAHGVPMMALGGVYSFMSGKRSLDLLPSMKEFNWSERQAYIVFDNDVSTKPEVLRAQIILSQRLLALGARISFISIPPGPEKGVDDFIVKFGAAAFAGLIERADPFLEAQALWELNSEATYIKKINVVIELETGLIMDPESFKRHRYVDRFYMKSVERGTGKNKHVVLEQEPLAPRWMEWAHKSKLWDLTYEPGQSRIYKNSWNAWTGWGVTPKKGDVRPWTWLLDFLFANDPRARKYFEQWCAYPIQHPGAKLFTACVLWSRVKRLGKSMVGLALSKIYGENSRFVESRELKANFNSWAKNRQLVIGEEITAGEARVDADYLKYIITHPSFTIRDLYTPAYDIPNHTNFLFLSNHPDAMFLEDGDQRYLIHGINQPEPAERKKYEWCDKWLHGEGPSHLMDHFLRMNLKGFNPREHAPATASKYEMITHSKSDLGLWVQRLQDDPITALKPLSRGTASEIAAKCDLFTAEQLYHAFDPELRGRGRSSVAAMGRALAAAGLRQLNGGVPVGTATGIHRLYAVRNVVTWDTATRKEIRVHYDSFFSPKNAGAVK